MRRDARAELRDETTGRRGTHRGDGDPRCTPPASGAAGACFCEASLCAWRAAVPCISAPRRDRRRVPAGPGGHPWRVAPSTGGAGGRECGTTGSRERSRDRGRIFFACSASAAYVHRHRRPAGAVSTDPLHPSTVHRTPASARAPLGLAKWQWHTRVRTPDGGRGLLLCTVLGRWRHVWVMVWRQRQAEEVALPIPDESRSIWIWC